MGQIHVRKLHLYHCGLSVLIPSFLEVNIFYALVHVSPILDPRLILAVKPSITSNDTTETVMIDWTGTFVLNGQLREYVLSENGDEVYSGVATTDTRPFKAEGQFVHIYIQIK